MRLSNDAFKVAFDLPDVPTVSQIMRYDSAKIMADGAPILITLWECARTVMEGWECEHVPSPDIPLDTLTGIEAAQAVEWAGVQVSLWRSGMNEIPKN